MFKHYALGPGLHKVDSGASAASGQTQISWTNFDQNHVYLARLGTENVQKGISHSQR